MTRNGKIARLPHSIRSQVNERLQDGEEGKEIVQWLNELEPVRELVAQRYGGHPVSEQNLSEWRQGGYEDWLRHQETRAMSRDFLDEATELAEETDGDLMTDRLAQTLVLTLMRLLREAMESEEKGPKQRAAVLEIAREFDRLRRGDHRMVGVRRQCKQWDMEQERKAQEEEKLAEQQKVDAPRNKRLRPAWEFIRRPITAAMFGGGAKGGIIADYIYHVYNDKSLPDEWFRRCDEACPPPVTAAPDESDLGKPVLDEPELTESHPIKPDHTEQYVNA